VKRERKREACWENCPTVKREERGMRGVLPNSETGVREAYGEVYLPWEIRRHMGGVPTMEG